ncbi:MAG: insulinase family protein, partial [Ferruginibacter sp.]
AFANKYLGNNYLVIYKRKGEDKNIVKVEKPAITPVETNANAQSPFVKKINAMPATTVKPVWINYDKDLQKTNIGPAQVLYVQNKENPIFRLRYRYDAGTWNDKKLAIAAQYLQFLGTPRYSAEEISKEFYKIACSFSVNAGAEYTTVTIEGLDENFNKAVDLFEYLLANCEPDEQALKSLKARLNKGRTDAKANKGAIMNGLTSYARFGAKNPFNNVLTNDELSNITAKELTELLHTMNNISHKILYYGPKTITALAADLKLLHPLAGSFATALPKTTFAPAIQTANQVLFADYNMVQAETRWTRNNGLFDPEQEAVVAFYNNYFGDLVFQTIRESKALAYSTFSFYATPEKKEDPYYTVAYVGSQSDKFNEAALAMNELLTTLPRVDANIENARQGLRKDIETQRIVQDGIIFNYLDAQQKGLTEDIRIKKYQAIDKIGYNELKDFHAKNISGKPYVYTVVASEKRVNMDDMKKLGEVKKLDLEEIFGY